MNTALSSLLKFPMIASIAALLALSVAGMPATAAQDAKPQPTPEDLLRRFVEECLLIEPGTDKFPRQFQMGGHFEGPMALPAHTVTMTRPFRICRYETTQELYAAMMGSNPSRWKGPRNSVETMSFNAAELFCSKLTSRLHEAKLIAATEVVRLPTEAEWEYCCRAGTDTRYSFGDAAGVETDKDPKASILDDYAWHTGNAAGNDPAVGVLKPNPWGLYDVHGYLWEFVSEPEVVSETPATADPKSPVAESTCIIRGGSWQDRAALLTSGARRSISIQETNDGIGFRCVIAAKPAAAKE